MNDVPDFAQDALLSLLFPVWQIVIGACVLVVVILSIRRFAQRGPSRMTTALLVTSAAIVSLVAIGIVFQGR